MMRDLSFPKARRLTSAAEFARVREHGRKIRGTTMSIAFLQNDDGNGLRAGFITSRKVGGAVTRNRVRRRLRDIVRHQQHAVAEGIWLVVIASPAAANTSYAALKAEWLRLARRASILAP
jgi:ribonuclease P protein component